MFSLDQKLTLESFHRQLLVVFCQNFFEANEDFFQKFQSALEVYRSKRKFQDNLVHNILELYNVSIQSQLNASKAKRDI